MAGGKGDIRLKLYNVTVEFLSENVGIARAEGNNAAWMCECGTAIPLVGRCYFQFGHDCHTVCPDCLKKYRVIADAQKKTVKVKEYI